MKLHIGKDNATFTGTTIPRALMMMYQDGKFVIGVNTLTQYAERVLAMSVAKEELKEVSNVAKEAIKETLNVKK